MKVAYFYLTQEGGELVKVLDNQVPGTVYSKVNFKENMAKAFSTYDALVCIMATGIVVRTIAALLKDKTKDPAVIVMDQKGKYVISLLSGHIGGANELAAVLANISGGIPVITTATDVTNKIAFDVFAKKNNMEIENIQELKKISGSLVDDQIIDVYTNEKIENLYNNSIQKVSELGSNNMVVIHIGKVFPQVANGGILYLRPKVISVGVGCKRNTPYESICNALKYVLKQEGISPLSIKNIATIPLKQEEEGIIKLAQEYNVPLYISDENEIAQLDLLELNVTQSDFVKSTTGVASVSTASAYLASNKGKILVDKQKFPGITIAIAKENCLFSGSW